MRCVFVRICLVICVVGGPGCCCCGHRRCCYADLPASADVTVQPAPAVVQSNGLPAR